MATIAGKFVMDLWRIAPPPETTLRGFLQGNPGIVSETVLLILEWYKPTRYPLGPQELDPKTGAHLAFSGQEVIARALKSAFDAVYGTAYDVDMAKREVRGVLTGEDNTPAALDRTQRFIKAAQQSFYGGGASGALLTVISAQKQG